MNVGLESSCEVNGESRRSMKSSGLSSKSSSTTTVSMADFAFAFAFAFPLGLGVFGLVKFCWVKFLASCLDLTVGATGAVLGAALVAVSGFRNAGMLLRGGKEMLTDLVAKGPDNTLLGRGGSLRQSPLPGCLTVGVPFCFLLTNNLMSLGVLTVKSKQNCGLGGVVVARLSPAKIPSPGLGTAFALCKFAMNFLVSSKAFVTKGDFLLELLELLEVTLDVMVQKLKFMSMSEICFVFVVVRCLLRIVRPMRKFTVLELPLEYSQ